MFIQPKRSGYSATISTAFGVVAIDIGLAVVALTNDRRTLYPR